MALKVARWFTSIILIILAINYIYTAVSGGNESAETSHTFKNLAIGAGLFVASLILIAKELAQFVASPMLGFIDGLFMSGEKIDKPPLSYKLADFYTKEERYNEACEEYEKIIKYYPEEKQAYMQLAEINSSIFAEFHEAEQVLHKALAKLPKDEEILTQLEEIKRQEIEHSEITPQEES